MTVRVLPDSAAVAAEGAERLVELAREAISVRGRFDVALAGGATPREMYSLIPARGASTRLDWSRIHVFWGDERCVPRDDRQSNYGMAWRWLLSKVQVPEDNVHRMEGEKPADKAAEAYEEVLKKEFGLAAGAVPVFDLILLGMGPDGHTASLFPGSPALEEKNKLVVAPYVERLKASRISLSPPVIMRAARVIVLISGAEKADALRGVLEGPLEVSRYPAQILRSAGGEVTWLVDGSAARFLRQAS